MYYILNNKRCTQIHQIIQRPISPHIAITSFYANAGTPPNKSKECCCIDRKHNNTNNTPLRRLFPAPITPSTRPLITRITTTHSPLHHNSRRSTNR